MSCSTCPPVPTPSPVLTSTPPCEGSEPCVELVSSECVVYRGPGLDHAQVVSGERLNGILKKVDDLLSTTSSPLGVKGSTSVRVTGTGEPTTPYRMSAVVDPQQANLLRSTANGLLVKLGVPQLRDLLTLIKNTPELTALFCSVCSYPSPSCQVLTVLVSGVPAADPSEPGTFVSSLSWGQPAPVSPTVDALPVSLQYRPETGAGSWQLSRDYTKQDYQATVGKLLNNTLYEFRLVNHCSETDSAISGTVEDCFVAPVSSVAVFPTTTTVRVTFPFQQADTDGYELAVLTTSYAQVFSTVLSLPLSGTVGYTFLNLRPGTDYLLQIVSRVRAYRSSSYVEPFRTGTTPCLPPTDLSVIIS